jgi:phosphonate degradation associated HDIG domain protein
LTGVIDELFGLFARFGSGHYGEGLSLERHMLQSAAWARSRGAPDAVVAAALLHDIGYFLHPDSEDSIDEGRDVEHESLGAAYLSQWFGPEVTAPVALHVQAKRYLCAVEDDYYARLSDASRKSLALQGGVMAADEVQAFEADPHFDAATLLRRCDDRGKDIEGVEQPLESYRALLESCLRATG